MLKCCLNTCVPDCGASVYARINQPSRSESPAVQLCCGGKFVLFFRDVAADEEVLMLYNLFSDSGLQYSTSNRDDVLNHQGLDALLKQVRTAAISKVLLAIWNEFMNALKCIHNHK